MKPSPSLLVLYEPEHGEDGGRTSGGDGFSGGDLSIARWDDSDEGRVVGLKSNNRSQNRLRVALGKEEYQRWDKEEGYGGGKKEERGRKQELTVATSETSPKDTKATNAGRTISEV